MTDRPILFNGEMVRAILDGRKTQTRRILRLDEDNDFIAPNIHKCDRLWVREAWRPKTGYGAWDLLIDYPADGSTIHLDSDFDVGDWSFPKAAAKGNVPSIHMPRWASRLTLTVTDVRVQRLQDITLGDICAEGLGRSIYDFRPVQRGFEAFQTLWDSIYGTWGENPWVAAYTFTAEQRNIDEVSA